MITKVSNWVSTEANQPVASLLQDSVRRKATLPIATLGVSFSPWLDSVEGEGRSDAGVWKMLFRVTNVVVFLRNDIKQKSIQTYQDADN